MILSDLDENEDFFILTCRSDGLSPSTIVDYRKKLGFLLHFLKSRGILSSGQVTSYHIRAFLDSRREFCKPISIHGYYRSIKRFFNFLVEEHLLTISPMLGMRPPKVDRKVIRPLYNDEIEKLLKLCDTGSLLGARNYAIILVLYDTGLRVSELAGIELPDIDADREIIKVMGKGARERYVRIGVKTQHAIARYLMLKRIKGFSSNYLWLSEEGIPLKVNGVSIMLRKLGKLAGLSGVRCSPHTLRHSFATAALRNQADIKEVQTLLGHSTPRMTRHYTATITSQQVVSRHKDFSPVEKLRLI